MYVKPVMSIETTQHARIHEPTTDDPPRILRAALAHVCARTGVGSQRNICFPGLLFITYKVLIKRVILIPYLFLET
jgi:hypothetical protein